MPKPALVEPRLKTPAPRPGERTNALPDTLVSEQVQRLAVCAAVAAGLWAYGLVMDTIVRPLTLPSIVPASNIVIEIAAIAVSALMFAYVRCAACTRGRKANAGLLFVVLNAVAVALLNTWPGVPPVDGRLSWTTVVILVGAMIVPGTPRKILATSIVAASMDPLAVWLAHLRGLPVHSIPDTLVMFMPNYACAAVATVPSRVLQRLGRRLRQAQEMGSYHLIELLGRGGMGEVWRAEHRLLARSAAIKLIRPELLGAGSAGETRDMLRRFEEEAQATAALSSPHTIRLFDFGVTEDQTFYYVMELLEGRDLEAIVRAFGPLPAERALFLLEQVCHSLADAHARGLVHRDVTPSNVYVCRMGLDYDFVKVLDFGLVKFNDPSDASGRRTTRAQTTTGTPAFMAPETILGLDVDERADVYAIGCLAYYLLTGMLAFEATTPAHMFIQHVQAEPVPPSQRTEMPVPAALDALVLACLAKDPARRPRDASALLSGIRQLRTRDVWDNGRARAWWERHLPDLSGPLTAAGAAALEPTLLAS